MVMMATKMIMILVIWKNPIVMKTTSKIRFRSILWEMMTTQNVENDNADDNDNDHQDSSKIPQITAAT